MPRNTHPQKRRIQARREIVAEKTYTPDQLARQLVTKGLASVRILDNPLSYLMQVKREG